MNTKKSKNKHRSKPVQPPQDIDKTGIENVTQIEPAENTISVKNEDDKVQEVSILEDNNLVYDVPKKPMRTKGKKNKDTLLEDKKHVELPKPPKHQELEENVDNSLEECIQEVPNVRKKKKKNKKHNTHPISDEGALSPPVEEANEKDELKEVIIEPIVDRNPQTVDIIEKDATTQKKKKKKKNRIDSDKSDKIETQNSCTIAFQKLLQSSVKCDQEISDSESISKGTIEVLDKNTETPPKLPEVLLEKYEEQKLKEEMNIEDLKSKDKNKKSKQKTQAEKTEIESKELLESIVLKDNIIAREETKVLEESPKIKAQIAKPVDKKRKNKRNLEELNKETISPSLIKAEESLKLADTTQLKKVNVEDNGVLKTNIETEIFVNEQLKHKEVIKSEEVKCEFSELSHKSQDEDQTESDTKTDYSDFIKVKTNKSKKRKNKDVENLSLSETGITNLDILSTTNNPDILSNQVKPCGIEVEEVNNITIAPDFIDHPRSVSQTDIDNNNNTIIQEITTPEEIKLGISIFTTVPIVQGSGESPEAENNKADSITKVTEIPIEKTDIKSKMIEVNKDMEELRRSIERSLAELTNTETESNIEKDFEEIFQNQIQESQIDNADSIIKNENESLNLKNEEMNIEGNKIENENTMFPVNNCQLHNLPAKDNPQMKVEVKDNSEIKPIEVQTTIPVCPARKDKGKGKSKKKGKQDISCTSTTSDSTAETTTTSKNVNSTQESKKEEESNQKADSQEKCKKQTTELNEDSKSDTKDIKKNLNLDLSFEPIENFEDALTSSVDDINKTFELIAKEVNDSANTLQYKNNPEIKIIAPVDEIDQEERQKQEERRKKKQTPVSPPKNLLSHTDIPVQSNKSDYKKEKNKAPNYIQAKVKIKDSVDIEKKSKEVIKKSENRKGEVSENIKFGVPTRNANHEFVYKYNFRKVFLQSVCNLCKSEIVHRNPCKFCSIVFYCSPKHKDEDWPQHQPLCFALSTIAHLKDQKHIYADAKNITGQEYRVLRMQMILSCERILKRKLVPWEQEAMLYPRICADVSCREWKQQRLTDCEGCGQISYCTDHPEHLPSTHQRWCKPYALYKKLVMYHQNFGKLEPRLPTKVLEYYQMTDNINEVLGSMYEEKIDISDIQYATLTQIASPSLTAVYCYQLFTKNCPTSSTNGISKKSTFTVHTIGNELQSEADSLDKWETFFLHLLSDVKELRVVFIDPDLNQSNLPLDLLGKIKLCESCRSNKRRLIFNFEDKKNYHEYYSSEEFIVPNIVCAFNPNIHRSSLHTNKDNWPSSINCILKQKIPFVITSYTLEELKQDIDYIKRLSRTDLDVISEPKHNPFASVRPDRNFISDHEMPLLFKNYGFSIMCGA